MSENAVSKRLEWVIALIWLILVLTGAFIVGTISHPLRTPGDFLLALLSPRALKMIILSALGAFLGWSLRRLPPNFTLNLAPILHWGATFLVGAVFLYGVVSHGARRWIAIGGFSFQPSELVKVTFILLAAKYLGFDYAILSMDPKYANSQSYSSRRFANWFKVLVAFSIPAVLILLQPDLGTTLVLYFVFAILSYIYGWNPLLIIGVTFLGGVLGFKFLKEYQLKRILVFLDPYKDPQGAGWNVIQSMNAIGSGGLSGVGMGKGQLSRLGFVPEVHTDFIMAFIGEEWGFLGVAFILAMELLLILLLLAFALRDREGYKLTPARVFAVGIASLLFIHTLENSAMCVSMLPVTGLTMPFISYGGTSAFTFSLGIWMALSLFNAEREILLEV